MFAFDDVRVTQIITLYPCRTDYLQAHWNIRWTLKCENKWEKCNIINVISWKSAIRSKKVF